MPDKNGNIPKSEYFKNALCYFPFFGAILVFFIESKKSKSLEKNMKYGFFLLLSFVMLQLLLSWMIGGIIVLLYIGGSIFLGWKAYNGENIELEYVDEIEKKVKEKL